MEKNETARRSSAGSLICPRCGSEMNRHAVKVDPTLSGSDAGFDGILQEFHTCPRCRYVLERHAE
jgi:ribosomal protein S27AE